MPRRTSGDVQDLLPLSPPVYNVLLALGDGLMHGYAIMQSFESMTAGEQHLLPGTLYATLARMVEAGLLEEASPPDPSADARRRYYRVTGHGKRVALAETDRMARLVRLAHAQNIVPGTTG